MEGKMGSKDNDMEKSIDCKLDPDQIAYCSEFRESIIKIVENYRNMERSLVTQLLLETPKHHPTTGAYREEIWRSLFERMIPRKYCIEQNVFIIDSFGRISAEVDLAVFDETYTPYIFNYGRIKFIPIEAVAVVIQCKSYTLKKENLKNWVDRIMCLQTSLDSAFRTIQSVIDNTDNDKKKLQTATRPICMLCTTASEKVVKRESCDLFDITLYIEEGQLKKIIREKPFHAKSNVLEKNNREKMTGENLSLGGVESDDLISWYQELNHFQLDRYGKNASFYKDVQKIEKEALGRTLKQLEVNSFGKPNVIMSLTFQLNQLLMMVNNPIPFPHRAYVNMFNWEVNHAGDL